MMHLLFGNVLAVSAGRATELVIVALAAVVLHILFTRRFVLITFDPEAARIAGVNTRFWSVCLNLAIGVAVASAVHEIGALLTFTLLTLHRAGAGCDERRPANFGVAGTGEGERQ